MASKYDKTFKRDDNAKFSVQRQIRLTNQMDELVKAKALEKHTTDSEIIRQAVANYINRAMSDTEIVHASLVENSRKIRYLEKKIELFALIVFEQTKFLMRVMPTRQVNTEALVEKDFERFKNECMKSLKSNHGGILESMILDLYEQSGSDSAAGGR
ncbi:MAG: hypothetical protein IJP90_09830 [Treponema sp.]|nr:hypothetical protein [Treponema sp.]MBR0099999.1 hypothetical protein [Treponema sp.]